MSSANRRSALFLVTLILLVAAALRLAQVGAVPPGLHYDEAADTIIAREIAEGRSTPIFIAAYTGKEVLFFYWAAGWMKLIGATPFAMRLAAAMLGVLTVAATYWAVREMFAPRRLPPAGKRQEAGSASVALLAAVFIAASFWHVLMSRLGFRSIAEPCVQALAVGALWRGLRLNDRRWLVLGGVFAGLNVYTYLAARMFPVAIALLFAYLIAVDAGRRRERLIQFGLVVLAAIVVFAPLGIYFVQNPAAFLTRIAQVAPRAGQSADLAANIARALGMFFVDGDPYVRFNLPGRPLFPVILGFLFIAGVAIATAGVMRGQTRLRRAAYFFALASTAVMLLPTALAVNEITPSNLRAIGMMPVVFVFPALGMWVAFKGLVLLRRRTNVEGRSSVFRHSPPAPEARRRGVVVGLLVVVSLAALDSGRAYFAEYVRLPQLYYDSDGDLVEMAERLNRVDAKTTPVYVHALHYRHPTLAALVRDFVSLRSITGPDVLVFPPGPSVQVFAHLALPDRPWLNRFLSAASNVDAATGPDGQPSFVMVRLSAAPSIAPQTRLAVNFGNTLELIGYDLESTPQSGGAVDVTLYWHVLNAPDRGDYSVFADLRDAWGFEWGRAGSFDYPSEQWTAGETIVQRLRVPVAAGAPRGDYRLDVGWYSEGANKRLPILAANGALGSTAAAVDPIPVARPARGIDETTLGIGMRIDAEAIGGLRLIGASLEAPVVPQGGLLIFTLFWRADGPLPDQPVSVRLSGTSATGVASTIPLTTTAPVHNTYPFDEWLPGETVADRYGLRVPVDALPGEYALEARVGSGAWIGVGQVRVEAAHRQFDVPPIAYPLKGVFGDQIELLGYDLDRNKIRAGEPISLTLYWHALKTPDADYTVFTHLLDASGVQRGGKDNPPVNGTYNTSLWIAGEVVADRYAIPLDADAPPGEYTIEIGLYRFDSGARLPLSVGGDALRLAKIQVAP